MDTGTTRLGVSKSALTEDEAFKKLTSLMGANSDKSPPASASEVQAPPKRQEPLQEQSAPEYVSETSQDLPETAVDDFPETLSDLASRLEVEPQRLQKLKTKVKVDGAESEATLQDLIKSYQLEGHLTNKSTRLADRAREMESEHQRKLEEYNARQAELGAKIKEAASIVPAVLQEITNEYNKVNWDELRVNDPGEFAARQTEIRGRYDRIYQKYQEVEREVQKQNAENQRKFEESNKKFYTAQTELLLQKMPELADESVARKRGAELNDFLMKEGYSKDEILNIRDHRQILTAFKAMEAEKSKAEMLKARESAKLKLKKPEPTAAADTGIRAASEKGDSRVENNQHRSQFERTKSTRDGVELVKRYLNKR